MLLFKLDTAANLVKLNIRATFSRIARNKKTTCRSLYGSNAAWEKSSTTAEQQVPSLHQKHQNNQTQKTKKQIIQPYVWVGSGFLGVLCSSFVVMFLFLSFGVFKCF